MPSHQSIVLIFQGSISNAGGIGTGSSNLVLAISPAIKPNAAIYRFSRTTVISAVMLRVAFLGIAVIYLEISFKVRSF